MSVVTVGVVVAGIVGLVLLHDSRDLDFRDREIASVQRRGLRRR